MFLAALLPLADMHRVRESIPAGRVITFANSEDLCQALENPSFDALIIDTALVGGNCADLLGETQSTRQTGVQISNAFNQRLGVAIVQ